jgi:hypothetical protein
LHPNGSSFNKPPMPRKSIRNRYANLILCFIALFFGLESSTHTFAADPVSDGQPKFLGANTCSSSSCHGGGGANHNQYITWSTRDFHFQRPYATLTTARSKQISAALNIKDAVNDQQCISCHAPLRTVPENLRGDALRVTEAVSCEVCHGAAQDWLRSHTRSDYTHADRVAAGMRDLKNLYVRANACVACHQNVSLPLLQAGHPGLIFEMDGQAVSEPKHWRENEKWNSAQAWAVGQSAALREMLWQLDTIDHADPKLVARADALLWLFEKVDLATTGLPKSGLASGQSAKPKLHMARAAADIFARALAELAWSSDMTAAIQKAIANVSADFRKPAEFPEQHARRAERLVLALDRLYDPTAGSKGDAELKNLFALSQSIPDFDPLPFATALENLSW